MPGVHPREAPRPTGSHGEQAVWRALHRHLMPGWWAWHSLRVRTRDAWVGEGDFVLAHPARGLLVIEVKGGTNIEQRDGRWYRDGEPFDPGAQAERLKGLLLDCLRERRCGPPAHGVALCFPDLAFDEPPTQADLAGVVLGQRELVWLGESLPKVVERALPRPSRQRGNWIAALHAMWGETWKPRLSLGSRIEMAADDRIRLDEMQLAILAGLEGNDRMLVRGGAGSGKTLVAREAASRLADRGQRVLLLTYTEALAHWLATESPRPDVKVAAERQYCRELLEAAGVRRTPTSSEEWEELPVWAALEALPIVQPEFDAIIVDEGQDLTAEDWGFIAELARGRRLWVFHDPEQAYWEGRGVPREWFPPEFRLPNRHRCAPAIHALADAYVGSTVDEVAIQAGFADRTLGLERVASASDVPAAVGVAIDQLLAEGLRPQDIAVLSILGRSADGTSIATDRFGRHPVVQADDDRMRGSVVAESYLRFKGLERPAVIVTDLRVAPVRQRAVRMHIALTRALDRLRIVADGSAIDADPVLSRFADSR